MTLQERLMEDLKDAMRAQDAVRRGTIRLVRAAIKNAEIEWQREANDEEVLQIIAREIRRREEAIVLFRQGHRQDLVDNEQAEMAVLKGYLPQQLSRDEIVAMVRQIMAEQGATSLGQLGPVMREAMARMKGKADGRLVNQVVRELLAG
ncbi:MAG: GatB/YqeY domain-containing protein [Chloroflexota bacterium]